MSSRNSKSTEMVGVSSGEKHDPSLNQKVEPQSKGNCMFIHEDKYGDLYLVSFRIRSKDDENPDESVLEGMYWSEESDSETDTHENH